MRIALLAIKNYHKIVLIESKDVFRHIGGRIYKSMEWQSPETDPWIHESLKWHWKKGVLNKQRWDNLLSIWKKRKRKESEHISHTVL